MEVSQIASNWDIVKNRFSSIRLEKIRLEWNGLYWTRLDGKWIVCMDNIIWNVICENQGKLGKF